MKKHTELKSLQRKICLFELCSTRGKGPGISNTIPNQTYPPALLAAPRESLYVPAVTPLEVSMTWLLLTPSGHLWLVRPRWWHQKAVCSWVSGSVKWTVPWLVAALWPGRPSILGEVSLVQWDWWKDAVSALFNTATDSIQKVSLSALSLTGRTLPNLQPKWFFSTSRFK